MFFFCEEDRRLNVYSGEFERPKKRLQKRAVNSRRGSSSDTHLERKASRDIGLDVGGPFVKFVSKLSRRVIMGIPEANAPGPASVYSAARLVLA